MAFTTLLKSKINFFIENVERLLLYGKKNHLTFHFKYANLVLIKNILYLINRK